MKDQRAQEATQKSAKIEAGKEGRSDRFNNYLKQIEARQNLSKCGRCTDAIEGPLF